MEPEHLDLTAALAARLVAHTSPDLLAWFGAQGVCRYALEGDEHGDIIEIVAPPVLLLGPGDGDARACPHPDRLGYPVKPLAAMTLDDFHVFLVRWFTRAVEAGICRCLVCKQPVTTEPEAPWDGIFIDKELVAWIVIHFDCKRGLAREIKGRHPFELAPRPPEPFDVTRD